MTYLVRQTGIIIDNEIIHKPTGSHSLNKIFEYAFTSLKHFPLSTLESHNLNFRFSSKPW